MPHLRKSWKEHVLMELLEAQQLSAGDVWRGTGLTSACFSAPGLLRWPHCGACR